MSLRAFPISIRDANAFVRAHHRHHKDVTGGKFAIAAKLGGRVVGVVIAGRPKARHDQAKGFGEVTRVCTDGTPNACSFLYARARRVMQLMGYEKFVTFILENEDGGSVIADGWKLFGTTEGGSWSRPSRPRTDDAPTCPKKRFEWAGAA